MKLSIKIYNFIWYLALLPFLFPSGFSEYSEVYKNFRVGLLLISATIILIREFILFLKKKGKIHAQQGLIYILLYHSILLICTLVKQGNITEGLQKIFIVPAMCILMDESCDRNLGTIIDVICNILIIILFLNITLFSQFVFPNYFLVDHHIMFIGHVQTAAEISILGLLIGYLGAIYFKKKKYYLLIVLCFITMIYSKTAASFLAIFLILVLLILKNIKTTKIIICKYCNVLTALIIIFSFVLINANQFSFFKNNQLLLNNLTNGRFFIWSEGQKLFTSSPIIGYGAYGVLIKVFWSQWSTNKLGFNYAHSTILQLLLDGGVILMLCFLAILFSYLYTEVKANKNMNTKYIVHSLFIIFLTVGMFESLTEYYYIFIFLTILPYVFKLDRLSSEVKYESY